jgi:hypothetical protein
MMQSNPRSFYSCFREHSLALDVQGCEEGESLLEETEEMSDITRVVTIGLYVKEKMWICSNKYYFLVCDSSRSNARRLINSNSYSRQGNTKVEPGLSTRFDNIYGKIARRPNPEPIQKSRESIKSYISHAYQGGTLIVNLSNDHLRLPKGTLASLQRLNRVSGSTLRMLRYLHNKREIVGQPF